MGVRSKAKNGVTGYKFFFSVRMASRCVKQAAHSIQFVSMAPK